jgi:hypothetical protein
MRLSRGSEVLFNPEVDLQSPMLEPTTSSNLKVRGLWRLGDPQQAGVEPSGSLLCTPRHCQLDVFDPLDRHTNRLPDPQTPTATTRVDRVRPGE